MSDLPTKNVLVALLGFSDEAPLFDVFLQRDHAEVWPIGVNIHRLDKHFFLDARLARELGKALILAADAVDAEQLNSGSRFCAVSTCRRMVRVTNRGLGGAEAHLGNLPLFYVDHRDRQGNPCPNSRQAVNP